MVMIVFARTQIIKIIIHSLSLLFTAHCRIGGSVACV